MNERETLFIDRMATPLGLATLIADAAGALRGYYWEDMEAAWSRRFRRRYGNADFIERRDPFGHAAALARYFDGEIGALETLPVMLGGTPFQRRVWSALRGITPGTTVSYGALAQRIGAATAVRAVGLANGSNPIGVVVPCHRVIGGNGSLTGYGGGLPRKRWLLEHEARHSTFQLAMSL
jgi:methylated-DNA-[protein]-cysteine S-methyltransferase